MKALIGDVRAVHQFLNAQASTLGTMSEKVRDSQCMGLCKKIAVQHLDMTESTKILKTLNGGPWSQENKEALANALTSSWDHDDTKEKKRQSQKVTSFSPYLTTQDVELMRSKANMSIKLNAVVDLCVRLMLHLPSEPSCGVIVKTIFALSGEGTGHANFYAVLNEFKRLLRLKVRSHKCKLPYVELPADPKELPAEIHKSHGLVKDMSSYV